MVKRNNEKNIDDIFTGWVSVNRQEDPMEWNAWKTWRRQNIGSSSEPENFTVPSPFPPSTILGAKAYAEDVQRIRRSIGWNGTAATINIGRVSAYMG